VPKPFRLPFLKSQVERDLDRELALHLELKSASLEKMGLSSDDARREAERLFGDRQANREACLNIDLPVQTRAARRNALEELVQDLSFAVRSLRRNVGVTIVIVAILALGVGATTAVFSLYETVVISPVQTANASRLVWIENVRDDASDHDVTTGAYFAWRDASHTLAHLGTFANQSATLIGNGAPARLEGAVIGDGFLSSLDAHAELGRVFAARDYEAGAPPVVMLSRTMWGNRYHGDSSIIGRAISLDEISRTVVGIMPASIDLSDDGIQFWLPSHLSSAAGGNFTTPRLQVVGLLKNGVTAAAAERELSTILSAADTRPTRLTEPVAARVTSLPQHLGGAFRSRLLLVFAAVGCVLAVGCANVAGLLLARGVARQRELAIRASLGASRGRLVRQLLTENALLTFAAGALGLLTGTALLVALKRTLPAGLPHLEQAHIDMHAALFALAVTSLCCVVAGMVPAIRVAMVDVRATLQGSARGTIGGGDRLRRVLIVAEVCMATVLLVTAGLLVRSASALDRVPLGFNTDNVVTMRISLPRDRYETPASIIAANTRLLAELRVANGASPVALVSRIPLVSLGISYDFAPTQRAAEKDESVNAAIVLSSPNYFRTIGIPLVNGRDFTDRDLRTSPRVAIVNEAMARRMRLGDRTVGSKLTGLGNAFNDTSGVAAPWEIVGVAADTRDWGSRNESRPQIYLPIPQTPDEVWDWTNRTSIVVAQGAADPNTLARLRGAVQRVDATLPLYDIKLMADRVRSSNATERAYSVLLIVLGLSALALAAAGIYAMLAYAVRQRLPEIGVRIALGASPSHIVQLIVKWVLGVTAAGVVLGLVVSVGFTQLLSTLLFGVRNTDAVTLIAAGMLMALTALLACIAPARRALGVSADSALRSES
jgi:putative ABC transport system permease protein